MFLCSVLDIRHWATCRYTFRAIVCLLIVTLLFTAQRTCGSRADGTSQRTSACSFQVIGGELQERLIPVPYSKSSTDQAIRVVNAFRQGLDARYGEHSNTSLAEVLRKQTSLSKRLSQTSSIEYADNIPDELTIPEIDVERLSSHSHTETAV
ncbi:hypothetical protein Zmor_003357 [Zophobas morio]|uniref:Uncharacterized protein n=1 Tax=Zophobas morio TaxID=2755281 RepID=A0AA38HP75_9CUCU|nr:hypothetical protein Zmor_003357 [Zophobas morio]